MLWPSAGTGEVGGCGCPLLPRVPLPRSFGMKASWATEQLRAWCPDAVEVIEDTSVCSRACSMISVGLDWFTVTQEHACGPWRC